MSAVYSLSAAAAFIMLLIYITDFNWKAFVTDPMVSLIIIGLFARLALSGLQWEYPNDLSCFRGWSYGVFERGFSGFYFPANPNEFIDYPPGYIYVLYIVGFIRKLLGLDPRGSAFRLLIKLPAIFSDLAIGLFLYKLSKDNKKSLLSSRFISLAFLLNPAVLINSVVWGQVDSFYTLFILISLYYLVQKRYYRGFGFFAVSILIKPQAFMFTPIYLFAAFSICADGSFKLPALLQVVKYGAASLGVLFLGMLPFTRGFDFTPFFKLYFNTISSYPYATLNAYNFYCFLGANFGDLNQKFLFLSYGTWGGIFINIIVVLSVYLLYRNQSKANFMFAAALINILTFMFSVRMHERYLYPALPLLAAAYIYQSSAPELIVPVKPANLKPDYRLLLLMGFFSITLFVNCADVLYLIHHGNDFKLIEKSLNVVSIVNLFLTGYLIFCAFRCFPNEENLSAPQEDKEEGSEGSEELSAEHAPVSFHRKDYILMAILMAVYGGIAFYRLGNLHSPQTTWTAHKNFSVTVDFGQHTEIDKVQYLLGARHKKNFRIEYSQDEVLWLEGMEIEADSVFSWGETYLPGISARYVKITSLSNELMLQEMAFRNVEGRLIPIAGVSPGGETLFDEQQWTPEKATYMNGTYFDEIYHGRTAYEFIHHLDVYETTHPPLGKALISWGIRLFGMTPFGWRFSGTLIGVLMIPVLYIFGKKMFRETFWAFFTAFIFTFDFMHFTQTRISTIDSYVTFFIMLMYYFMYRYYSMSFCNVRPSQGAAVSPFNEILPSLLPLGLSGLCMGLAVASKWQGVYAASGLAVIFFYALYIRANNFDSFPRHAAITLCCCLLFFIAVPLVIYCLSYIPFLRSPGEGDWFTRILKSQESMFQYHSNLESEHPFSSPWWQWPFDIRPVFFYANKFSETLRAGISTFGNPAVWWMGIIGFFYTIHSLSKKYNKDLIFLIIAFLSQYLPWVLVSRTTYIYHYFPSIPFIALMITFFFKDYVKDKKTIIAYGALVLVLFIIFYPVLSGMPVHRNYVVYFLRWFRSWQLVT